VGPSASVPTPETALCTPAPIPTATFEPICDADAVTHGLDQVLSALEAGQVNQARDGLEAATMSFAALKAEPGCLYLTPQLLAVQVLVQATATWEEAQQTGSVRQAEEVERLAAQAVALAPTGREERLATRLLAQARAGRADLLAFADPGRVVATPETLATEQTGGLHPLCGVNSLIKPLLAEQSGAPVSAVARIELVSNTLYLLAGGDLMTADLDRILGPSPAVFLQPADGLGAAVVVAGARVSELVDLTRTASGDLLLLEKSGRLLRRTPSGEWSLERPAVIGELPVAVAPYSDRSYLLDPLGNQVWRHLKDSDLATPAYFDGGAVRDVSRAVDMAIDGAVFVARSDAIVRRYYVGFEDPRFRPDTNLGVPSAVFLPDEPNSTLVYVVDSVGRRVLGLDRETGAYRLGFHANVPDLLPLTAAAVDGGRLFLTDGRLLLVTILNPKPVAARDCPAFPFPVADLFDAPQLKTLNLWLPVEASLPITLSLFPGGRWPQVGYGVLDGMAFVGLPVSETVRAMAAGTVTRVIEETRPLLEVELGVISTTQRVPAESADLLWGRQIWIDHGDGVQTRYGGLGAVVPGLAEGQPINRLTIIGFVGRGPLLVGVWVDGDYAGKGLSLPETAAAFRRLFAVD
jgi:murein DD-endopeptidase MepM/ murein hydrolase activator NlpD